MKNLYAMNSPFRYAGGKFYARKLILEHIPVHNHYIEPFAGGGSIFFAKNKATNNQLNDLDNDLVNVYLTIRDNPDELVKFLKVQNSNSCTIPPALIDGVEHGNPLPASKKLHGFFKNEFVPLNDLDRAGRWYYLNRTSYSGIMNSQNMYWGYGDKFSMQPKNWEANIRRTSKKLQDVIITSEDFEHVIDNALDSSFLFIDPPYFNADQDKFYTCSFTKNDHFRLEQCIRRNNERLQIFITYDNSSEVRELYSWMHEIHDKEWNYCIQRTDDQKNKIQRKGTRYKGKEIFILNYDSSDIGINKQLEFEFV